MQYFGGKQRIAKPYELETIAKELRNYCDDNLEEIEIM